MAPLTGNSLRKKRMNQAPKHYEIVVAGAGIAGISAALAAARHGHSVALLEKQTLIGGLATSGLVFIYLPLCDGNGTQVTFGQAEELLRAALDYGPFDLNARWHGHAPDGASRDRCSTPFSPAGFVLTLDRLLREAGVDLWLDTMLCRAVTENGRITAVEVENASGRITLTAACFIDATGDAGLVRRAGGGFVQGGNSLTPWFMEYTAGEESHYSLAHHVHIQTLPAPEEKPGANQSGLSGKESSAFTRNAWEMIRRYYDERYSSGTESRKTRFPLHLPAMAQFRTIARISGRREIRGEDCNTQIPDSVGMAADWRCAGKVWETPYGALLPEKLHGVLAAGRCIAAAGDAWEVYRAIPACALTGEVAGRAAALSVERGELPEHLPLSVLRDELRGNHFVFHRKAPA